MEHHIVEAVHEVTLLTVQEYDDELNAQRHGALLPV
jgi:hypothetical protein